MLVDPSIRDRVLIPLLIFVAVTAYLRSYLFRLLQPAPPHPTLDELKQKTVVGRSQRLRMNGAYISPRGFAMRKETLLGPTGALREEVRDPPMNPMASMDMMKMQMVNQFLMFGLFYVIQNALAGFLVVKLPFGLTERFKQMTQQGIALPSLDTSFVSSGSWYMIAQSGLQRVLEVFVSGGGLVDETKMMQMQAAVIPGAGGGAPGQGWMPKAVYQSEVSSLAVASYSNALAASEAELLSLARAGSR